LGELREILVECSKLIGTGLATIGLVGAGVGVGVVFGSLVASHCKKSFIKK
jgi:F-type H+-transporting ATPase subunit c